MGDFLSQAVFVLFVIAIYFMLPSVMAWGWVRWAKCKEHRTVFSVLSLTGFALASSSGLLVIALALYANLRGGFPFYDPLLLRFYRWGVLLSAAAIVAG